MESCQILGVTYDDYLNFEDSRLSINYILLFALTSSLIVSTILLNAASIIPIVKSTQLNNKPCYFIILVQSVIDFTVGLLAMPLFLFYLASNIWRFSSCLINFVTLRSTLPFLGLSTITLSALTVERYIAILHPYAYTSQVTKKKLLVFVGVCAGVEIPAVTLSFAIPQFIETYAILKQTLLFSLFAFAYTRIYLVVKKLSRSRNRPHDAFSQVNLTKIKLFLREIKEAKSCFIVVICFSLLAFVPTAATVPFQESFSTPAKPAVFAWVMTLAFSNSSINSVIFFWTRPMLRKEALKVIRSLCFRQ